VKNNLIFGEKSKLRRRLAGNLGGKSADSASVEDGSPLLQLRLDLPPTLPTIHPPVATNHFERSVTGGAAQSARAFCFA